MVHFVIAGKPDCKNMVQVLNTVYYLKKNLPNFEFRKIELPDIEWTEYLVKINHEHGWHHSESPLIYKETLHFGASKPTLIGGISEFWEYCYDYYGIESTIESDEVDHLLADNMKNFNKTFVDSYNASMETLNIMIYGATNEMATILLPALMDGEPFGRGRRIKFILYDEKLDYFSEDYFDRFNEDFKDMYGTKVAFCDNLGEGLKDTHLLIFIDDTSAMEEEKQRDDAMKTHILQIFFLAEEINLCGRRDLRIIFANDGCSCLIATILARKVEMPHSQIVVVSSDLGLGYLGEMSRRLNIRIDKLGAPPVWGSLGFNEFVDAGSALMKCKICKPNKRAVRASSHSTLNHGTTKHELRFINYLSDDIKDLQETVNRRRSIVREKLQRAPMFGKLEALLNLVQIWYGCSSLKEPVISLGVMSDGSFGIRDKIVISQPAIQFRNGWVPFAKYPVPEHILDAVKVAGEEAERQYWEYVNVAKYFRKDYMEKLVTSSASKYKSMNSEKPTYAQKMLALSGNTC